MTGRHIKIIILKQNQKKLRVSTFSELSPKKEKSGILNMFVRQFLMVQKLLLVSGGATSILPNASLPKTNYAKAKFNTGT